MREIKDSVHPTPAENSAERRRSHRVYITMPVIIRGKNGNHAFNEETRTASVNAHGCMVRLAEKVVKGQEVAIVNPKTVEELPCTVTFIGQKESGKTEVGLEFIEPSPQFWRITFPSDDWDPSERKRPTTTSSRPLPQHTKKV
jgi:PilZ domain